jgi:hypothetical protein
LRMSSLQSASVPQGSSFAFNRKKDTKKIYYGQSGLLQRFQNFLI